MLLRIDRSTRFWHKHKHSEEATTTENQRSPKWWTASLRWTNERTNERMKRTNEQSAEVKWREEQNARASAALPSFRSSSAALPLTFMASLHSFVWNDGQRTTNEPNDREGTKEGMQTKEGTKERRKEGRNERTNGGWLAVMPHNKHPTHACWLENVEFRMRWNFPALGLLGFWAGLPYLWYYLWPKMADSIIYYLLS